MPPAALNFEWQEAGHKKPIFQVGFGVSFWTYTSLSCILRQIPGHEGHEKLHALSKEIMVSFSGDIKAMKYAEKIAKKAANSGKTYTYYYTYAEILMMNGKKDDALDIAHKSLELAGDQRNVQMSINQLIQKIEQS